MKNIVSVLLLSTLAFSQTTTPTTPNPGWSFGGGVERNTYGAIPTWVPALHVTACWSSVCEITTLETGSGPAAQVREDFGYKLKRSPGGSAMLIAIVGAGLTQTSAPNTIVPTSINLGTLGGGAAFMYDPGAIIKFLKGKGVRILLSVREVAVTSVGVQPQYAVWLNFKL